MRRLAEYSLSSDGFTTAALPAERERERVRERQRDRQTDRE